MKTTLPVFADVETLPVMRAMLGHIIAHANIVGHDLHGRPVLRFEFAGEDALPDILAGFKTSDKDDPAEDDWQPY